MRGHILQFKFNQSRKAWGLLALSILSLQIIALYFQYGLGDEPCIKCIYQRLALWGIFVSILPGLIFPKGTYTRLTSYLAGIFFAGWGFKIAAEHVAVQQETNPLLAGCDMFPDFPSWFNPDIWFPALFEVRGDCGDINWQFLDLSMPQWMKIIFLIYILILAVVPIYHLIKFKQI